MIVSVGGLGLLALLFAGGPTGTIPASGMTDGRRRTGGRLIRLGLWPVLVALVTGVWLDAWGIAGCMGLVTGLCMSTWMTGKEVKRAADLAESVSSLATVLANQATAATTVIDAVANAAPLVSGPVRKATLQMGADCEIIGVGAATARFKRNLGITSADWLGDIVDISSAGGGRWMDVAHIFETEAGEEAELLRYLLRKVGSQLPTLVAVMILSVGIVAGLGWMSAEVGGWLRGPQGQVAVAVATGLTALLVGRMLSSVRGMLR